MPTRARIRAPILVALAVPLLLASLLAPPVSAGQRPLSDFLNAQGTTNIFVPPVPDYIAWANNYPPTPQSVFASVDYAGLAARWLRQNGGTAPGTQLSGSVLEVPLSDGRAQVTVVVRARSALTWAIALPANDLAADPTLFGSRAQELLADPSLTPALSSSMIKVVFDNTAPGAPLPDLVNAFILGNTLPGQELVSLSFTSSGKGPLHAAFGVPDGTPGMLNVQQTGLFGTGFHGAVADAFPAEIVNLRSR